MSTPLEPEPARPAPPLVVAGGAGSARARFGAGAAALDAAVLDRLGTVCAAVSTDPGERAEAGRDWWPLALTWAGQGEVANVAAAVARPRSAAEVAAVLAVCAGAGVPVTAAAGRSGVCGGTVPAFGGVVVDLCGLSGIVDVDDTSLTVDVRAGTFGAPLEAALREDHGLTLGHWPQSVDLSTVGGWLACRSAGQLSTRYGKIEDMVIGLDVALADGRLVTTGGPPRQAVGPDLTQLFVGSEGTLGVITGARLRVHPAPAGQWRAAWGFVSFGAGLDAIRRVLRRGATPAVLRLYDATEADRSFGTGARTHVAVALDEGDAAVIGATRDVLGQECLAAGGAGLDASLVERWLEHRDDVGALGPLIASGLVLDTMEVAAPWATLGRLYEQVLAALRAVDGTIVASAHQSHSYPDGGCLYFTFAGQVDAERRDAYYVEAWDAGVGAALRSGGSLAHHHGVGLNRGRFVRRALGGAFDVVASVKAALDPRGVLNPGKLGLPSPFGPDPWPPAG